MLGVPACGLHHRITALDLVLPRILTGEKTGKAELAFLVKHECDEAQGYLFSRPLPTKEFEQLLLSKKCFSIPNSTLSPAKTNS